VGLSERVPMYMARAAWHVFFSEVRFLQ